MRKLDHKLGRIEEPPETVDDLLERSARLGDKHEERMLRRLQRERQVVEIDRPPAERDAIAEAVRLSTEAFRSGAEVVFQAAFFDGRFLGYADFIQRTDDGRYEVYDTKLARSAKITALLQLAAYSQQLELLGIPIGEHVHLLLGDDTTSTHRLRDIMPVYLIRRARLEHMIDERVAAGTATEWGDPRYAACGRCDVCDEQVELHRDVLLVAGMRSTQRTKLRAAGITTIDELAAADGPVDGINDTVFEGLKLQAQLQITTVRDGELLPWVVLNPRPLAALPTPDPGDIFFDFEGDPLYQEGNVWGIDYLFGLVEPDETFVPFWAHNLAEERQALIHFLAYVTERRARHPGMHIYHYASYERTHLLTLAARHGYGEEMIDDLLRNNVLVDLYPIVRQAMRIGSRSYSLKKLEPLYMGDRLRESDVTTGGDSITAYVEAMRLASVGETDASNAILHEIADYNRYDCVSTLALRDWLLDRARENGITPAFFQDLALDIPEREPDPVYLELTARVGTVPSAERDADETALALASAAIDYHRREQKSFWWDHFTRLTAPLDDWRDTRNVLVIDEAEVERDWRLEEGRRLERRRLRVRGTLAPGSSIKVGDKPFLIYDEPYPPITRSSEPGARTTHDRALVVDVIDESVFVIEETLERDAFWYSELPMALTPSRPPFTRDQEAAISWWGRQVLDALPGMLPDAALDILRRVRPRGPALQVVGNDADGRPDYISAIRDSLLSIDRSYLAVQGPPGTGKTFTGSRVIAQLVRDHGWKIGVVAQSHSAVENMLSAVLDAGADPARVGKKPRGGDDGPVPWTPLDSKTIGAFAAQTEGFVLGGTAWDFSNAERVARGSLDLLVIDEAGQYSLANTIASSVAAKRMLLLGDPQQLPQVSQGTHPEPIDLSALGWLTDGHDVLPPELGYFLATSWRMHEAVCEPVSVLAYEGKLRSHPSDRRLEGVEPGLHTVPLLHTGNSTASPEEAEEVVRLVRDVVGRPWASGRSDENVAPLGHEGVIVVAPYNAQVELIRRRLREEGFERVPVGTVDKFQGREAAVAIVSLSASSADDVPRGLEFLLMSNRLNVAISRAQWAAYLVYSPGLIDYLPRTPRALADLSAFITLVGTR